MACCQELVGWGGTRAPRAAAVEPWAAVACARGLRRSDVRPYQKGEGSQGAQVSQFHPVWSASASCRSRSLGQMVCLTVAAASIVGLASPAACGTQLPAPPSGAAVPPAHRATRALCRGRLSRSPPPRSPSPRRRSCGARAMLGVRSQFYDFSDLPRTNVQHRHAAARLARASQSARHCTHFYYST